MYKGFFKEGKRSGEGTAKKISGEEYTGSWKAGLRDGFGHCLYADGVETYQVGNLTILRYNKFCPIHGIGLFRIFLTGGDFCICLRSG